MYGLCAGFYISTVDMEGGYPRAGFLLLELRHEPMIHSAGLTDHFARSLSLLIFCNLVHLYLRES
jgi:hypothetical protein